MDFQRHKLHFLLVPLMSQSHLIPFTDLAKLLAQRGLIVSIVMTPVNAERYRKSTIENPTNSKLDIRFVTLTFPCKEAGLPEGCENMDSLPHPGLSSKFFQASNMLQGQLDKWLQESTSKPCCIISDACLPWTKDVSDKFNIPRLVFHGISCFCLLCSHNLRRHNVLESVTSDSEAFLLPGIPDRIQFTKSQIPEVTHLKDLIDKFKEAELSAQGVIVNSFEELELSYLKCYQEVVQKTWCVGPVSLVNYKEDTENGTLDGGDRRVLTKWLDSKKKGSVLYVCFGSLYHMSHEQMIELGLGLEASCLPFIWVIRKGDCLTKLEGWFQEEGYEERVQGRGLVVRGWAPQVLILSHPSIGGFLTHCGWNSTLEGVSAGLPMLTWPLFAEQFYNEKLIVEVLKIGVQVGVKGLRRGEDKVLGKEHIKKAIQQVMDGGEEGEDRKRKAKELGEMAKRAIEGGSSYSNMTLLIQHVINQFPSHI